MECQKCGGNYKLKNGKYICSCCGSVYEGSSPVTQTVRSDNGVDVFDKTINGVLEIVFRTEDGIFSGSGSLLTEDGYALTNTHVVTYHNLPCNKLEVKIAGEYVNATVVKLGDKLGGRGNGVDLAIIKLSRVPANAHVIRLGNYDDVRIGQRVYVVGNAKGEGTSMTSGIVSDRIRNVSGKMLMMTDCAVNPGNSGGPIFNEDGIAIGTIVSKRIDSDGMNYAIPSNTVRQFVESVIKNY